MTADSAGSSANSSVGLNFIGGRWVPATSGEVRPHSNPSNTDDIVGFVQVSASPDIDAAVAAARAALPRWIDLPAPARGAFLYRAAVLLNDRLEEVAVGLSTEQGKPISEARAEVRRGVDLLLYYAGEGMRQVGEVIPSSTENTLLMTRREPLGVVAVITPWNFPIAIPLWKICPALVYGNTVVLKPSDLAPMSALAIGHVFDLAGLPPGALNVVTGPGSALGQLLVRHGEVRGVSFTGSNEVGGRIAAISAGRGIRFQLEMGGKNAAIVLPDADLDQAASLIVSGAMRFAGQKCTATSRAIVHREVLAPLTERVRSRVEALPLRPALDEDAYLGPVVSRDARDGIMDYIRLGLEGEGRLICGGRIPSGDIYSRGHYLSPTVFSDVDPGARIAQEEIFGPVLSLIPVDSIDDAISVANAVPFGLSCSLFTRALSSAMNYIDRIEVGMVRVNAETTGVELQAPFGGVKASGSGPREQGRAAIDFYTQTKTITISWGG